MNLSDDNELIGSWVFRQVGKAWAPEGRTSIGLERDGEVLAGLVFEDYTGTSVFAHSAVKHPHVPLRKFLVAVFYYAFVDLGVDKLIGMVPSYNLRALKANLWLGFHAEAVIEGVFPNGDLVIMVMNRQDCKLLASDYRKAA